ncbi:MULTISPECIES: DEAD/DEAH box helicase [Bradyrhizobium]|uniref:DEAD/DEAH box helicase n=1 Tax=Bradyrhizobium TaxID=374 RepID=UPI0013A56096|nr:DEAD/DEAH box helicase family protein [Bradyrhizobium diazoefficiens]AWO87811.2 DEAD/DEAH box helicase family protein [Bradyrhizobium diazoefficiens]
MSDAPIPIQPVENPILCSPYREPDQHWLYDTVTGIPTKMLGRRPASYWFKSERTGTAQQQLGFLAEEERDDLPLVNALREDVRRWRDSGWENASQTSKKLLRHWWREDRLRRLFFCQIEAAETVIYLKEILALGKKTRWTPKLTLADFDLLCRGQNPRPKDWVAKVAQHPKLADIPHDVELPPIPRYACKMATGSGKTVLMAMLISWAFCNRGTKPSDPRYPRRALIVCPNLTIKERLSVLRAGDPNNYYEKFDIVPSSMRPELAKGKVLVTNWHWFNPESEVIKVGGVQVGKLGAETPEAFAKNRLGDLWDTEPLMVLNDEGHHAYRPAPVDENIKLTAEEKADREEATVWVSGLDKINSACGINICVDLSATPFYIHGSGYPEGSPFPWIVSDFSLVDAIESGITKIPRLPALDNTGRPDPKYFKLWDHITRDLRAGERLTGGKPKPEVVYRKAEDALLTLAGEWKERLEQVQKSVPGQDQTPPVMIVVCDNTNIAERFFRAISGEELIETEALPDEDEDDGVPNRRKRKAKAVKQYGAGLPGFPELWNRRGAEVTLRIDSKLLAAAESEDPTATKKEAGEELRKIVSTVGRPGEAGQHIRCVVSVNMLSEGWDANNVTHILGLRAFHSQLLCEQVVGRGLRRMDYTPDPETGLLTAEYVDIFGVPFSLIPFKGRYPGQGPSADDRPKHEVMALPERKEFEIRFPIVEGYVVSLKRNLITCDVSQVERTVLDPWNTPTAAFVRPQVGYQIGHPTGHGGFGFEIVNRQAYYDSIHLQTIEFEIAREVTRALTDAAHPSGGRLRSESRRSLFPQVLRIVQKYIAERVDLNGLNPCEIGLQTYAQRIAGLLISSINPDDERGEARLLPRLNRYKPIGSTENVRFKTVKPVQATTVSHLNFVACDTGSWEQAAVFQIEKLAKEGMIHSYARNDRLEFNIPYELYGNPHVYEPDFIVRLRNSVHVALEIKGKPQEDTNAKNQAAKRWVSAVNHWGGLGEWNFLVCRDPQQLSTELTSLMTARADNVRAAAIKLQVQAEAEVARLRSLGWTQTDFARALRSLLENKEQE